MTPLLIKHDTLYKYSQPVHLGQHRLMLRPRVGHDIRIVSSVLDITPAPAKLAWTRDVYGNSVAIVDFKPEPTSELSVQSVITVEHYDDQPLDFLVDARAVNFPYLLLSHERIELWPYLVPCYGDDQAAVADWVHTFWLPGKLIETYVLLDQMNRAIAGTFAYAARDVPGVQRPGQTLAMRSGSCRDFATLMIEACRYLGLPARFVSGYASTEDIPAAFGATHAWTEVYLPGVGWKGFDSTGGIVTGSNHIATAVGRDPESLPPIAGSFICDNPPVGSELMVTVSVTRAKPEPEPVAAS
jgi:transglutaminase-like putative cysteine protease